MSRISFHTATAIMIFFAPFAGADSERELMKDCEGGNNVMEYVKTHVPDPRGQIFPDCEKQIESSASACFGETAGDLNEFAMGGTMNTATQAYSAHAEGVKRYIGHAQICKAEMDKIKSSCQEGAKLIGDAHRGNEKSIQEDHATLERTRPGSAEESNLRQSISQQSKIGYQLQRDRNATINGSSIAQRLLGRRATCYVNVATIYADARDRAGVVVASSSSAGPGEGPVLGLSEPTLPTEMTLAESRAREHAADASAQLGSSAAAGHLEKAIGANSASEILQGGRKVAGMAAGNLATLNGPSDPAGFVQAAAETGVERFISPKAALRVTGVGTFLVTVFEATPTSRCSEIFYNPVEAYRVGCTPFIPQAARANENAISILTSP